MPLNSSEYLPSETGKEITNVDFSNTSSFGVAFPDIDNVSPCTTLMGFTFSSVTLAPAFATDAMNAQSNNRPMHSTTLICFMFTTITDTQFVSKV